ncbi:hypothetical protein [Flavobacterium wongokense]|uniref:hypothetical protein n=1 Tax=Flavobacterium wongokense TaxID=2910674 RepID=UPI001F2064A9|nr:hypothetical protein [Flavobacterium sp. WG47]MCF6133543.1 hypothetical protein [Flavobacterium sp. WG47]
MKPSFILSILFILFSCSQQKISNNEFNLKGHVKKIIETTSFPKKQGIPSYSTKTVYTFNHHNCISIEESNINGLIQKKEFIYDKDNILKESRIIVKGKIISKSIFIKNKNKQIIKIETEDISGKSEIVNRYSDTLSRLPVSGTELKNGSLSRTWKIEYENELTSVFTTTISGNTTQLFYEYNSNNDFVKVVDKNNSGEIINTYFNEYKYDKENNWIEEVDYNSEKEIILSKKRQIKYW